MQNNTALVKQAISCYQQGDYQNALNLYQKAASKYGRELFNGNIQLCKNRLNGTSIILTSQKTTKHNQPLAIASSNMAEQLQQTQQLLEHYYQRTQQLEYKLLDQ